MNVRHSLPVLTLTFTLSLFTSKCDAGMYSSDATETYFPLTATVYAPRMGGGGGGVTGGGGTVPAPHDNVPGAGIPFDSQNVCLTGCSTGTGTGTGANVPTVPPGSDDAAAKLLALAGDLTTGHLTGADYELLKLRGLIPSAPEPASIALLAAGLIGIGVARRRARRS